ncbi:hypothetical protein JCM19992_13750 [Thermostilla marina]
MTREGTRRKCTVWMGPVVVLLLGTAGCNILATAAWIARGHKVSPEFEGLKEKRVAVVCRPLVNLSYRDSSIDRDLARNLNTLLRRNLPQKSNVEIVDQQEVDAWTDENTWDEYVEVGKALKADVIIGVDIEGFSLYKGQTVYQGNADLFVRVIDCHTGETLFEKPLSQIVYPPNSVVPAAEKPEQMFRREFLAVLADEVGKLFYPYDPTEYMAMDAKAFHD